MSCGKTHDQMQRWLAYLGDVVQVTTVAIVREVLRGSSAQSGRALEECGGDCVEAAQWLARFRRCHGVAGQITPQLVDRIALADGVGGA